MFKYRLYDCPIASDIHLGGIEESSGLCAGEGDCLRLHRSDCPFPDADLPVVMSPATTHGRRVIMRSESLTPVADYRGAWVLEVEGAVSFFGHGGTGVISYQPVKPGEIHLVPFWFIHVVLPMYLSFMNGLHFFHAAAVEVEGEAMLIMAPSMGGKSTLAAHFLQMGHDLLADDKVMVRLEGERFWAATSHDRYRPYRKFEDLGVRAIRSAEKPLPIKAAILLQPEEPGTPIAVEPIPGRERFETLSAFTLFRTDDPTQGVIGPTGLMASRIPMYRVFIPRDLHQLPLVYQTIIEGLKRPSREPLSSMNC